MALRFTRDSGASKPDKGASDSQSYSDSALNRLKPHFVNNALTSIYYLIDIEPANAQQLTRVLSEYLLGVLEVFNNDSMISFQKEMNLVENYLKLEKTRFEDRLKVDYDIDVDDFMVPPLSVQIIVECAVKHGIAGAQGPGTVTISTRRLPDGGVKLSVIDDGLGFDLNSNDAKEPIYQELLVVQDRIRNEAGGEMTIDSTPEEGTKIEITLNSAVK